MAETMTLTTVLIDISTISTLLFVGFLIRQKIPFFYKYYIPTSLIAGILGLFLGPQVLGQFSPIHLHFSQWISQWTNFLFAFIFTTSFLGTSTGKFGRDVLSTTCVTGAVFMAQVLAGLGIAFLLSKFMSNVPYAMGFLPVSGFYGGHGSAGIMGGCFATEGWEDATGIALTYATIGMFMAVIGGMWIINWGAKKGYTRKQMSSVNLDQKDITGIVPKEERKSMATAISSSSVIDPLAFQMMIVGTIIAISHILREAIIKVFPFWSKIPLYTMCLIMGAIIGIALSKTKYSQYIDRGSMKRISGVALEYVIAMNVATIKLSVLASFLVPILVTSIAITILTAVICIILAKKWYGKDWFEMAMGAYGQCTGSLATGLLLIKVLDPNGDTLAAESVSGSSTLGSFWQQPYNTIGPMLILSSPLLTTLGTAGFLIAFLIVGTVLFGRTVKKA